MITITGNQAETVRDEIMSSEQSIPLPDKKRCPRCGQWLPASRFDRNRAKADGLGNQCKACKKEIQGDWYKRNKTRHRRKVLLRKKKMVEENTERMLNLLLRSACVDCGQLDPVVLEFDHVRGQKRASVARLLSAGYGWEAITEEIAKCEIRCANCHRRKTAKEQNWRIYQLLNEETD